MSKSAIKINIMTPPLTDVYMRKYLLIAAFEDQNNYPSQNGLTMLAMGKAKTSFVYASRSITKRC